MSIGIGTMDSFNASGYIKQPPTSQPTKSATTQSTSTVHAYTHMDSGQIKQADFYQPKILANLSKILQGKTKFGVIGSGDMDAFGKLALLVLSYRISYEDYMTLYQFSTLAVSGTINNSLQMKVIDILNNYTPDLD